jgi:hypothetical protein
MEHIIAILGVTADFVGQDNSIFRAFLPAVKFVNVLESPKST